MIAAAVARVQERSKGRRYLMYPAIDREELLRSINWTAFDILDKLHPGYTKKIKCVVIDERESSLGLIALETMLPDRIERIELLEGGAMLRVYTRDFVRRMGQGSGKLNRIVYSDLGRTPLPR